MSYTYTDYHHHQFDHPPRPETDPHHWPSLYATPTTTYGQPQPLPFSDRPDPPYGLPWFGPRDEQPPYTAAETYIAHQQHHPYLARQPTCWDPPWSSQTTSYQPPQHHDKGRHHPPYGYGSAPTHDLEPYQQQRSPYAYNQPEQQERAWDYAYGPPSYQQAEPFWQQRNPCPGTPPWQPDHTVLYPSIPPPLPQSPLSWHPPSFQPLPTALLPAAVAAPPHVDDSRQPSRPHFPSSMKEVISDPDPNLFCLKSLKSTFHTEECFLKLNSSTENMCSIENTFKDNVKDLEKESERFSSCREIITLHEISECVKHESDDCSGSLCERIIAEEIRQFDDKTVNDKANSDDGGDAPFHSLCDSQTKLSNISATSVGENSKDMSHKEIKVAYSSTCMAVSEIPPPSPPSPIFLPVIEGDFSNEHV